MIAIFMAAPPLAGVFGGPLSGWIMQSFAGQGLRRMAVAVSARSHPALFVGVSVLLYLDNGIRSGQMVERRREGRSSRNASRRTGRPPPRMRRSRRSSRIAAYGGCA